METETLKGWKIHFREHLFHQPQHLSSIYDPEGERKVSLVNVNRKWSRRSNRWKESTDGRNLLFDTSPRFPSQKCFFWSLFYLWFSESPFYLITEFVSSFVSLHSSGNESHGNEWRISTILLIPSDHLFTWHSLNMDEDGENVTNSCPGLTVCVIPSSFQFCVLITSKKDSEKVTFSEKMQYSCSSLFLVPHGERLQNT